MRAIDEPTRIHTLKEVPESLPRDPSRQFVAHTRPVHELSERHQFVAPSTLHRGSGVSWCTPPGAFLVSDADQREMSYNKQHAFFVPVGVTYLYCIGNEALWSLGIFLGGTISTTFQYSSSH